MAERSKCASTVVQAEARERNKVTWLTAVALFVVVARPLTHKTHTFA